MTLDLSRLVDILQDAVNFPTSPSGGESQQYRESLELVKANVTEGCKCDCCAVVRALIKLDEVRKKSG